jgi:hypothetical protein
MHFLNGQFVQLTYRRIFTSTDATNWTETWVDRRSAVCFDDQTSTWFSIEGLYDYGVGMWRQDYRLSGNVGGLSDAQPANITAFTPNSITFPLACGALLLPVPQ